jgi:hypothetical protein
MLIYDKYFWRIAYDTAYSKSRMIELYVNLHALQSDWNDELFAGSQPGDSSRAQHQYFSSHMLWTWY